MARKRNAVQQPEPAPPQELAPNERCELPELPEGVLATPAVPEAPALREISEAPAAPEDRTPEVLREVIKRRIETGKRERDLVLAAAVEQFNEENWT